MKKCNGSVLETIVFILVIIGGLNWGLVGIFNFDVVAAIFGSMTLITRIIYVLVGLAALYKLVIIKKHCTCKTESRPNTPPMNQ